MIQLFSIGFYFLLALGVGLLSYRKQTSSADFLIGNRSLNYWLTALAAHASDMSPKTPKPRHQEKTKNYTNMVTVARINIKIIKIN